MDATVTKNPAASTPEIGTHDQTFSKTFLGEDGNETSPQFEDGLIPSEHQQSRISEPVLDAALTNAQSFVESSSSHNLLSILQRPTFLESPAARWTAPPQWLQFQMLRSFDEGLMVSETQHPQGLPHPYPEPITSIYVEEVQNQVQINLQGLLQSRQDDSAATAAARWQIPESWAQSSMGDSFPIRPPIALGPDQDFDGLILADRRTGDPFSTPAVNCSFGLMQQVGYGERKLEFFSENFSAIDAGFFAHRVQAQAANTLDLMFLIITEWQPWFAKPLQEALPDFPVQTLLHFSSSQSASMLPSIDYNGGELTCIMEHINTRRESQERFENEREIDMGTAKAHCLPLVVWTRARGAIQGHPDRPLIVIISRRTDGINSKITSHYSSDHCKRWDRLAKNQAWVYLDLYFLFTKWDRIWGAVKQNLQRRTEEVHARQNVLPIQQQTRQLHKDNNIMISLREHVRIHKASLKIVMQRVEYMLGGVDFMATQGLKGRLDDAFQLLEYYEVTATTLLEQQSNLLSLAFNLETVAQGQAVARLNALAFIFLPLSFVASVFGITTFTLSPQWFPVAAVPALCTTVFIAYAAHKFFASAAARESRPKARNVHWSDDLEKLPTTGSRLSANTWNKLTRIFSRPKDGSAKDRFPTPSTIFGDGPSINDPSRLVRRSTDRSLADRNYVPPRSTVQFLPGAYDFSNLDAALSYPSAPTYVPPGTQAYDFAAGSGTYSQYIPQTDYYPYAYPSALKETSYRYERQELEAAAPQFNPHSRPPLLSVPHSPPPPGAQMANENDRFYKNRLYKNSAEQAENLETHQARAIFSFTGTDPEDLSFEKGGVITVLSEVDKTVDWWLGRLGSQTGIFPNSYVEVLPPPSEPTIPSSSYTQDGDETGYRPDGPDSFGLPPDTAPTTTAQSGKEWSPAPVYIPYPPPASSVESAVNEDLYSAEDSRLPASSAYTPYQPPDEDPYSVEASTIPKLSQQESAREQTDRINYGEEFQVWDREYSSRPDRASDLQTAMLGMDFGLDGGETEVESSGEGRGRGVSSRRRIGTLETIEE